jgi:hypothetical protein
MVEAQQGLSLGNGEAVFDRTILQHRINHDNGHTFNVLTTPPQTLIAWTKIDLLTLTAHS